MPPDGWEIRPYNQGNIIEIAFWEDGEKSVEFTLTRAQFDDLIHALVDAQ